jgi:hypothetical protein
MYPKAMEDGLRPGGWCQGLARIHSLSSRLGYALAGLMGFMKNQQVYLHPYPKGPMLRKHG